MGKALIVGGNGFIGSHLVNTLIKYQWDTIVIDKFPRKFVKIPENVHFIQMDFCDSIAEIEAIFDKVNPDIVFHLAWKTFPATSLENPSKDIEINIVPSLNLIKVCTKANVKLIFISSGGAVYGNTTEPIIHETSATNPISPYGIEKLTIEKYLYMYHSIYGLDYLIIRPSTPFGPWQDYLGEQGAVTVFMYRIAKNIPITLWGDGNAIRDYFYISDLVDAMVKCINYQTRDDIRIFNVGGGTGISLIHLLGLIEETVGKEAIIEQFPMRKFDPMKIVLDTSRINNELRWRPTISLLEGINRTWDWMSSII